MAQIFVSHSRKDVDLRNFFSNAFLGTTVKGIFEEFEKNIRGKVNSEQISRDIESSKAVFVILSQNVQDTPHTRDWIVWETGVAKNKDIWVFEPNLQGGIISVVIPYLRHYVIFENNNSWLGYIRRIIESYDDVHVLPTIFGTTLAGAAIGEALFEDKTAGGFLGFLGGLAISDKSKERPVGLNIRCVNCHLVYAVHIPQRMTKLRCPVCNKKIVLGGNNLHDHYREMK